MSSTLESENEAELDEQLAEFADALLAGESDMVMVDNDALRDLQETVTQLHYLFEGDAPSPELANKIKLALEKEMAETAKDSESWLANWLSELKVHRSGHRQRRQRALTLGALATLVMIVLLPFLSTPETTAPLQGTAGQPPAIPIIILLVSLLFVAIWWYRHNK
ncbi:MAG TPA: hypothetical protein VLL52_08415 [Anaerolineae bacterium]|nr:hypothetical protein [Anaerolineae bacterium]